MKITIIYNTIRPGGFDILYNNLSKQTFKDFDVVVVDAWKGERKKEVLEYLKEFNISYHKGLKKKRDEAWTLNKDYNLGLNYCDSKLIVFLQDYLWLQHDALERMWDIHKNNSKAFITGLGHKAEHPKHINKRKGKITIWDEECFEIPTGISEYDSRDDGEYGLWDISYDNWEMNLAAAPKKILDMIGGFEEDMDKYYGGDNVILAAKAKMAGADFILDKDLKHIGFNQSVLFPRPKDWEERHSNKGFLNKKLCQILMN